MTISKARNSILARLVIVLLVISGVVISTARTSVSVYAGTNTYPAKWAEPTVMDSVVDDWQEYNRECTSYVAWMLSSVNGFTMPFHGDASTWIYKATHNGNNYTVDSIPARGAVAASSTHVAWVEAVHGSGSSMTVDLQEYDENDTNHDGIYGNDGTYDERLGVAVGAYQYIHFKDVADSPPSATPTPTPTDSRVAVVARSSGSMDVFYRRSTDKALVNIGWNSSLGWGGPQVVGVNLSGNPAVTSRSNTGMDVFYQDANHNLVNVFWTAASGWSLSTTLVSNGSVSGDPTVIHRTSDSMDVFYRDGSGNLANMGWNSTNGWSGPINRVTNGTVASSPVATTRNSGQMSVFYRDTSNNLEEVSWASTNGWVGAIPRVTDHTVNGDLSASARGLNNVDVVYTTTSGGIGKADWDATYGWSVQVLALSGAVGSPSLVVRDQGDMDLFWQNGQGQLLDDGWNSSVGWSGPIARASNVGDNPVGINRNSNTMDVFFRNDGSGNVGNLTDAGWDASIGWMLTMPGAGNME